MSLATVRCNEIVFVIVSINIIFFSSSSFVQVYILFPLCVSINFIYKKKKYKYYSLPNKELNTILRNKE